MAQRLNVYAKNGTFSGSLTLAGTTFTSALSQTPSAGNNNQTPLTQYSDLWQDMVVSGLLPTSYSGSSLSVTTPSGTAYVMGQRVVSSGETYTYPASQDTYVDISSSGGFTHTSVANGAAQPVVVASSIRLFYVSTNTTGVTSVAGGSLRPVIQASQAPDLAVAFPVPTGGAASTSAGGGSWGSVGMYYYKITAQDSTLNETAGSVEFSVNVTATTQTVNLSWNAVSGATGYNIYRTSTSGSYGPSSFLKNSTGNGNTDTGSSTTAGFPPPVGLAMAVELGHDGTARTDGTLTCSKGASFFGGNVTVTSGTVTASHFDGGDVTGTTIKATTGTFSANGTSGVPATGTVTITLANLTPGGSQGSISFSKGIITAYQNPT